MGDVVPGGDAHGLGPDLARRDELGQRRCPGDDDRGRALGRGERPGPLTDQVRRRADRPRQRHAARRIQGDRGAAEHRLELDARGPGPRRLRRRRRSAARSVARDQRRQHEAPRRPGDGQPPGRAWSAESARPPPASAGTSSSSASRRPDAWRLLVIGGGVGLARGLRRRPGLGAPLGAGPGARAGRPGVVGGDGRVDPLAQVRSRRARPRARSAPAPPSRGSEKLASTQAASSPRNSGGWRPTPTRIRRNSREPSPCSTARSPLWPPVPPPRLPRTSPNGRSISSWITSTCPGVRCRLPAAGPTERPGVVHERLGRQQPERARRTPGLAVDARRSGSPGVRRPGAGRARRAPSRRRCGGCRA